MTYNMTYPNPNQIPKHPCPSVLIENDALGIVAFRTISDAIQQQTTDKNTLLRLTQIAAVFDHRTNIAVQVESKADRWSRRDDEFRLATFKPPAFFIAAAQSILNEVVEAARVKDLVETEKREKRKLKQRNHYYG